MNCSPFAKNKGKEILEDDYMDDDAFARWIALQHQEEIKTRSTDSQSEAETRRESSVISPRNPPITFPCESLNEYTYNDVKFSPKSCVELQDGDFMRILYIVRDTSTSSVTIRGCMYRRTREMNGLLDRKLNEVCWILYIDNDDPREPLIQGLETRAVSKVIRRRAIRLTNMAFPALSFRDELGETEEMVTNYRVLVCRYKYLCFYPSSEARKSHAWCEKGLHRLRANECDKRSDNNMADEDLRYAWRGETLPGGAKEGWLVGEEEFLRQEAISNEGKVNPMGDPMKRKIVGSILSKLDLSRELPAPAGTPNRNSASNVDTVISEETTLKRNELEGFVFPSVHAWQPQPRHRQRASPLSALDKSATHANEYGSAEVQGMVDHPHALGKRTIKTTGFRQKQARLSQTRRLIGGKRPVSCESSCSDSDETIGHSQSMESTQELGAPFNRGGSTATDFGPLSPLSLESIDLVKSSIITCRRDSILKRKRYSDHHMDMDDAFDLTVAPAIPSSRLHSEVRQPPTPRVHGLIDSQSEADLNYFEASLPSVARTTPLQHTHTSLKPERRRYTFGDCFCGAGGMSRGAINAGLCIIWGFDFDRVACETYAMNFFGTPVYNVWANEFANGKGDYKCDICHLSPPCQFWSIAHTIQGKDDEMNTASLFAILRLLERAKPRVVTLEQTAGLIRRHPLFFNAVINMFTSRGFSVRWRVLNCADFGVPQRRMRLFIIASW